MLYIKYIYGKIQLIYCELFLSDWEKKMSDWEKREYAENICTQSIYIRVSPSHLIYMEMSGDGNFLPALGVSSIYIYILNHM